MNKMIITCAVSGAETTRKNNPALPLSPQEIADSAYEAYRAGAAILHLHVRDAAGGPTQDINVFRETISLVRKKCDMVIEVTTGGAVGMTPDERLQPVRLEPDMASLDCGSVNFGDDYILNPMPVLREFASQFAKYGVRPTLECFDLSHIYASRTLIEEGLLKPPFHYGLALNIPGAVKYEMDVLDIFIRKLPPGSYWTVVGIGARASLRALYDAVATGGFMRVGFEDNVYYSKGVLAASNAQLVERAARISKEAGLEIAAPADVRKLLNLREA